MHTGAHSFSFLHSIDIENDTENCMSAHWCALSASNRIHYNSTAILKYPRMLATSLQTRTMYKKQ